MLDNTAYIVLCSKFDSGLRVDQDGRLDDIILLYPIYPLTQNS